MQENPRMQDVASDLKRVDEQMEKLEAASSKLWNLLSDTSAFLQFNWKVGGKWWKNDVEFFKYDLTTKNVCIGTW